jgi:hypothetical protein
MKLTSSTQKKVYVETLLNIGKTLMKLPRYKLQRGRKEIGMADGVAVRVRVALK